jgi:hypothetical protein
MLVPSSTTAEIDDVRQAGDVPIVASGVCTGGVTSTVTAV